MKRAELEVWAESVGLVVSSLAWARLERLIGLWQQYGRAINLVGTTERSALVEHIQEGLQCVACAERMVEKGTLDESVRWVDVGSGGGLPGLVVAAVRACEVILIEPRARRAAFLDLARAATGWGEGRVVRARWSRTTWDKKVMSGVDLRQEPPITVLSCRAVFSPEEWLKKAGEPEIPRGVILAHVELDAKDITGQTPETIVRGSRWSVMGFRQK